MRDASRRFEERGARVVLIGNGTPAQAAEFRREMALGLPLFVDPDRRSHSLLGLRRGILSTFGPSLLPRILRARRRGFRQTATAGDPWQQGGVLIVAPDRSAPPGPGRVLWSRPSRGPGEGASVDEILQHVP